MKLLKSIILGVAGATMLSMTSCNDWLDVNDNPDTPSQAKVKVTTMLPWIQYHVAYAYAAQGYRSQFICQALTATSRVSRDGCSAQWEATASMCTTPYQQFFVGAGPNIEQMYKMAMESGAYHYAAAAKIMKSYGFALMADMYGEMPYTEAIGGSAHPVYDNGETIYNGCLADIDEAISLLGKPQEPNQPTLAEGDGWNGAAGEAGCVDRWTKMAYLLKARLLNNLSKKSAYYKPDEIIACLDKAMQSTDDDTFITHYDISEQSSDFISGDPMQCSWLFDNAGMGGGNTTRATKWLTDLLDNFDGRGIVDPRAAKLLPWLQCGKGDQMKWVRTEGYDMTTSRRLDFNGIAAPTFNKTSNTWTVSGKFELADTAYVSFRSGSIGYYGTAGVLYLNNGQACSTANVYIRPDSPTMWATYAEACFIRAEVEMRRGNTSAAFEAYKKGIKANIDDIQRALTVWNTKEEYKDIPAFTAMEGADIDNFLTNAIGTAGDISMEKIMTQKFIAMLYTMQNWNDMRRHDYKDYMNWQMPYEYARNVGSTKTIPQGKQWRRIKQCSHELQYNYSNLSAIQPNYNDDDIWTYPVWWDIAD